MWWDKWKPKSELRKQKSRSKSKRSRRQQKLLHCHLIRNGSLKEQPRKSSCRLKLVEIDLEKPQDTQAQMTNIEILTRRPKRETPSSRQVWGAMSMMARWITIIRVRHSSLLHLSRILLKKIERQVMLKHFMLTSRTRQIGVLQRMSLHLLEATLCSPKWCILGQEANRGLRIPLRRQKNKVHQIADKEGLEITSSMTPATWVITHITVVESCTRQLHKHRHDQGRKWRHSRNWPTQRWESTRCTVTFPRTSSRRKDKALS